MSITLGGSSPAVTFPDSTVQNTAGLPLTGGTLSGPVTVPTLNAPSGVLATQNGMTGIAKAWVNFVGSSSPTINQSFNVSSVTYVSAGIWQVNFTTAFANTSYCPIVGTANNSALNTGNTIAVVNSVSQIIVYHFESGSLANLGQNAYVSCFGN